MRFFCNAFIISLTFSLFFISLVSSEAVVVQGCGVKKENESSESPEAISKPNFDKDVEITVEYPNIKECDFELADTTPKDPGESGKITIGGVDTDGDCLRDDIEILIKEKLPSDEDFKARKYLYIYSFWYREYLKENLDLSKTYEIANNVYAASKCFKEIYGSTVESREILNQIFSHTLNTFPRSYRYIDNSSLLGGMTTRAKIFVDCN